MSSQEHFYAAQHPLYRPVRFARKRRRQLLQSCMHLATVAAADIRNDHAHFGLRQIKKLRQLRPD